MKIEKVPTCLSDTSAYSHGIQTDRCQLWNIIVWENGKCYDSIGLWYQQGSEHMALALYYELLDGVFKPVIVKRPPNSHIGGFAYGLTLKLYAERIEKRLKVKRVKLLRYEDLERELMAGFHEQFIH